VIPYGGVYEFGGTTVELVVANLDWGLLYIFAIGSIAAYGTILAGWSSNSNWAMLGSLRASAQMISYEVTMGLSVVGIFMVFETLRLTDMAIAQDATFSVFGVLGSLTGLSVPHWLASVSLPRWTISGGAADCRCWTCPCWRTISSTWGSTCNGHERDTTPGTG